MEVTIKCRLNPAHPKMVYASMANNSGVINTDSTLDYCISKVRNEGYKVTNAQEVLEWLFQNVEFRAYGN